MGRWVTSKGRRIYIPDEGEENPFDKKKKNDADSYAKQQGYRSVMHMAEAVNKNEKASEYAGKLMKQGKSYQESAALAHAAYMHKSEEMKGEDYQRIKKTTDTISKNEDIKEKQLAANKKQAEMSEFQYKKAMKAMGDLAQEYANKGDIDTVANINNSMGNLAERYKKRADKKKRKK